MRKLFALLMTLALCAAVCAPVRAGETEDVFDVPPVLCCPSPSPEAQALMDWLCEIYGEKMISGQYLEEGQYGGELKAVASVTDGLYPALVGLDLMNASPASVSMGARSVAVDQAMEYWRRGHIITFCWHWLAPEKYLDTTGNKWWGGFYTENTSFSLEKAMNGEDPEGYALLLRDMDAIAAQLARLRDAGIPVLWRPLHEASGGWFWWGASGPEPYLRLYRLMHDRFTNEHGLNNLIWVWNGQDAAWYPGDDVVDIIGEDIYAGYHAHDSQLAAFRRCTEYTQAKKLIMMTECGCVPSPVKCLKDGAMWGAWAAWCYEYVQVNGRYSETYTSADTLRLFYQQEHVVTLRDVPAFGREAEQAEEAGGLTWAFGDGETEGNAAAAGDSVNIRGNEPGDRVSLRIRVPESGMYRLIIRQAGIGGYKENYLDVDGERLGVTVVQGEAEEDCAFGPVRLEAGEHTVTVTAFWGWVTLHTLTLEAE